MNFKNSENELNNSIFNNKTLTPLDKTLQVRKHANMNKIRTNLLVMTNQELSLIKKSCTTKINDKFIQEAEKEFSAQNLHHLEIKESFSPRFIPNKGQFYQQKFGNKIISSAADSPYGLSNSVSPHKECYISPINSSFGLQEQSPFITVTRKTSLSFKKMEFFRSITLKKFKDDQTRKNDYNSDCTNETITSTEIYTKRFNNKKIKSSVLDCNISVNILNNKTCKVITIEGFKYLIKLAKKLKIVKNKSSISSNLEIVKEILTGNKHIEKEFELKFNNKTSSKSLTKGTTVNKHDDHFFVKIDREFMAELKNQKNKVCNSNGLIKTQRRVRFQSRGILEQYCKNKNQFKEGKNSVLNPILKNKINTHPKYQIIKEKPIEQLNNSFNNTEASNFFIKLVSCTTKGSLN